MTRCPGARPLRGSAGDGQGRVRGHPLRHTGRQGGPAIVAPPSAQRKSLSAVVMRFKRLDWGAWIRSADSALIPALPGGLLNIVLL